jgi:hypothetical protein
VLIIAGVIILLIVCWVFGRGCGGNQEARENEKLREYTSLANKIITRSATVGEQFDGIKKTVQDMSRDDVARKLQQLVDNCMEISKDSKLIKTPEKAIALQPLLQLVLDMRSGGIEQYRSSLLDVLDNKSTDEATATMSRALLDLVVSDCALQRYRGGLEDKLRAAKFGFEKVADSVYMPKTDEALTAGVREYIDDISGEESGDALHGVAIVGMQTAPARVDMTESGIAILPNSKTFTVKVSVQNQGNQEEDNVPVVATIDQDPEGTQQKKTQKITRLKAGETATLVFEDLVPATGNEKVNILKVTAGPVNHEKKVDNNTMELRFIMRADAG